MIHIKKLNEVGDHFILIVIFILLFGILGTFWLIEENAASAQPELRSGMSNSGGPYCLDDNADGGNGTKVDAWPCNGTAAQKYSFSGGEIHIGDGCAVEQGASANSGVGGGAKWAGNVVIGSCSNPAPWGGVWTESGGTFHNTHAQSKGGQYCLDVEGFASKGPIDIYACNGGANQSWTASTYTSSGGGSSNGGGTAIGAELLAAAKQFQGLPYLLGGGHSGYAAFKSSCGSPSSGKYACEVDCSGLVSMATDMALGTNYDWTVDEGNGDMDGTGSSNWVQISLNDVGPGDIVTMPGHVEFVYSGTGSNIATFGAHTTGQLDGELPAGHTFNYTKAFRYE